MTLRATITTAALVLAAIPLAAQTSTAPKAEEGAVSTQPAPTTEPSIESSIRTPAEAPETVDDAVVIPDLPPLPPLPPLPALPPLPPLPPLPMLEGSEWTEVETNVENAPDGIEEGRAKAKEMREASRELRAKMRELRREYKSRLKDLQKLRVDVSMDSSGIASMMETVRMGLDSALLSLRTLDSNMRFTTSRDGYVWSFGGDSASSPMRWSQSIRFRCDSTMSTLGACRQKMVIVRSGDRTEEMDNQTVIIRNENDDADLQAADEDVVLDGELRSMIIVNGDTTFLPNAANNRNVVSITTTDSDNGTSRSVIVNRRTCGDSTVSSCKNILILSGDAAKEKLKASNPELVTEKSNVVIISTSKGKKVRRERKAAEPAPAAEKRSARTSSTVAGYALEQAIPNPASGMATIGFTIGQPGRTTLTLFDETGKTVKTIRDEELSEGTYSDRVDVSQLSTGLYLYRLVSGGFSQTGTLSVVR